MARHHFLRFPASLARPLDQRESTANFAGKHRAVGSFLAALAPPSACVEGTHVPGAGGQTGTPGPRVRLCSGQSRNAILKMSARRAVDAFVVVILPVRMPVGRLPIHRLTGWPTRDKPHHSSRAMRRCSRTCRNRSCNASNNSVGSTPYDHRPGRVRVIGRRSTPGQTNSFASSRTIQESSRSRPRCRLTFSGSATAQSGSCGARVIGTTRTRTRPSVCLRLASTITQGRFLRASVRLASASLLQRNA
jgi:hypothetical protein